MFAKSDEKYYDIILMDIRMPVMNGLDATRAIRKMDNRKDASQIPIVALTANAYDVDVQSCLDAGMNLHLAKPVDAKILYDTLAEMISP